jgi:hypothetical protein
MPRISTEDSGLLACKAESLRASRFSKVRIAIKAYEGLQIQLISFPRYYMQSRRQPHDTADLLPREIAPGKHTIRQFVGTRTGLTTAYEINLLSLPANDSSVFQPVIYDYPETMEFGVTVNIIHHFRKSHQRKQCV